MEKHYQYVIIGAQLTGGSAVDGIREVDSEGEILLLGREEELPYDRPPLSKGLWLGKKTVEGIFLHDRDYYDGIGVELRLGAKVAEVQVGAKRVTEQDGRSYRYGKLLLATGGTPRKLRVPGGDLPRVCTYRTLEDYRRVRELAKEGGRAAVIGGGFIGSEMAAALQSNGVEVTMIFPGGHVCDQVFPESLGKAIQTEYERRGVRMLSGQTAEGIEERGEGLTIETSEGERVEADFAIAGIGIEPAMALAEAAGLRVDGGIAVDEELRTSGEDVYAAGDVASFPYVVLGSRMRVEHWDHAVNHGKQAGRNMAGAGERYEYMPYFYSDLFEFGYEAVGRVESRLEVVADWEQENEKGVLYYAADGVVKGAMMCNVWDKVEDARELIRGKRKATAKRLAGAIG